MGTGFRGALLVSVIVLGLQGAAAQVIVTVAGNGVSGAAGDGGPPLAASLATPRGVAVDATGAVYIADTLNHRIRRIDTRGTITTLAGTGVSGFSGDGGSGAAAQLHTPLGLALDPMGNVYVADTGNHRIRRITPGGVISTVAGNGSPGYSGDGGPPTTAQLFTPYGVAYFLGSLYIADTGNRRIRVVAGSFIQTFAGNGSSGFSGDGSSPLTAALGQPVAVAANSGAVYIADYVNHRVRRIAGGTIDTFAGSGSVGNGGEGGPAISTALNGPSHVMIDPSGVVYFSDETSHRVWSVGSDGVMRRVAGVSGSGSGGDGGPATEGGLSSPSGLAIDSLGRLLIADSGNHKIRRVGFASTTPEAPRVDAVVPGDGQITVRFTPSFDGGEPVTSWSATCGPATATAGASPIAVTGLPNGTPQTCRVRGINAVGAGALSDPSAAATPSPISAFISPASLPFGVHPWETNVLQGTITLLNSGSQAFVVNAPTFSGPDATRFGVNTECPQILAAGASCTFLVFMGNQFPGPRSATLAINTGATGSPHLVPVSGEFLPPPSALSFTPSSVDLGSASRYSPPVAVDVIVKNTSTQPVTISNVLLGGFDTTAFTLDNACPATLPATGTCTLRVTMATNAVGTHTGTLQITTNAPGSPHYLQVTGAVVPAASPPAMHFDFNRDGRPDLVWSHTATGNTYAWYMNGPALIADAFIAGIDPSWRVQGVADFNVDGKPDLVWRNSANGNTYVWTMDGPTLVSDAFVFALPPEWVIQGVADFNADGKPDFLMRNNISGNAFAWFFDGSVAIGDQFLFNIAPEWKVEGVGDFNADGQPDLLFRNAVSGLAFAWYTTFSGGTLALAGSTPPLFGIDPAWEIVQVADWNADGSPDLVFRNRDSGVVFVWYVTGTTLGTSDFIIQIDPVWEIVPRR